MTAPKGRWQPTQHGSLLAISRPIQDLLALDTKRDQAPSVQILGRFRRALNLSLAVDNAARRTVMALVTPDVAIGPFHLVVDRLPTMLTDRPYKVGWEPESLRIGPFALKVTANTERWDPRPDWDRIGVGEQKRLELRRAVESLLKAGPVRQLGQAMTGMCWDPHRGRALVTAIATGDVGAVREQAAKLSGLGPGLTPSGDDYLAGTMLALWALHHPQCDRFCDAIVAAASDRTTQLSRAFLEAAGRGQADRRWHELLLTLSAPARGSADAVRDAVAVISRVGATSGLDMLLGFAQGIDSAREPGIPF